MHLSRCHFEYGTWCQGCHPNDVTAMCFKIYLQGMHSYAAQRLVQLLDVLGKKVRALYGLVWPNTYLTPGSQLTKLSELRSNETTQEQAAVIDEEILFFQVAMPTDLPHLY